MVNSHVPEVDSEHEEQDDSASDSSDVDTSVLLCLQEVCCCYCLHSVHGFERSVVSVDEAEQETLVVRMDIKGNTLDEDPRFRVNTVDLILMCQDVTTGELMDITDYES